MAQPTNATEARPQEQSRPVLIFGVTRCGFRDANTRLPPAIVAKAAEAKIMPEGLAISRRAALAMMQPAGKRSSQFVVWAEVRSTGTSLENAIVG